MTKGKAKSAVSTGTAPAAQRLSDLPDWRYLLQEFHDLYSRGRAGGSTKIRAHQRAVREAIARALAANPEMCMRTPETKPVTAHLGRVLDRGRIGPTGSIVRAIDRVSSGLTWLYGYEKVPRGLSQKYAFAQFAGPEGPIVTEEIKLGIVLFAPTCTYPAHAHDGLTESYYTLSGAVSENDEGVYAPGSLIFNPPGRMHRITVGDRDPALLAYAWHAEPETLAGNRMTFARKKA